MAIKFYWYVNDGEARIGRADKAELLASDRVYALDCLKDIIFEAENLYNEILNKANTLGFGSVEDDR
jgi:hypothetical protein